MESRRRFLWQLPWMAVCGSLGCKKTPPATKSGPLPHSAYIWQRSWTAEVSQGVKQAKANGISTLVPLAAEVSWDKDKRRCLRPKLDYAALRDSGCEIALAIRLGPFSGPFAKDQTLAFLQELVTQVLAEATAQGVTATELQLDFDAATSKLPGYTLWLQELSPRIAPTPLRFTALPDWLTSPHFPQLCAASQGYILQVHAAEKPVQARPFLVDPLKVKRWLAKADELGTPFSLALSTYRYEVAFSPDGKFLGIGAEGPQRAWPDAATVVEFCSDATVLADLVQQLKTARSAALQQIIWYRMPVSTDTRNWRWPTLAAVIQGRPPTAKLGATYSQCGPADSPLDIQLQNNSEAEIPLPHEIKLTLLNEKLAAGDGLRDYRFQTLPESPNQGSWTLIPNPNRPPKYLPPGSKLNVGWARSSAAVTGALLEITAY